MPERNPVIKIIEEWVTPKGVTGKHIQEANDRGPTYLMGGEYIVQETINLKHDLRGAGFDRTKIKFAPLVPAKAGIQLSAIQGHGLTVKDLRVEIDGKGYGATGGVVMFWGKSVVENVWVSGASNGQGKEGFAIYCDGTANNCTVTGPVVNDSAAGIKTELTAIAANQIIDCFVDMLGAPTSLVTHGITLLNGGRLAINNEVKRATVGYYVDSHAQNGALICDNELLSCDIGIQLSGGTDEDGSPRLAGYRNKNVFSRNTIFNANTGIYVFAPIAYEHGDRTKLYRWNDKTAFLNNDIDYNSSGIRIQAAHFHACGDILAAYNKFGPSSKEDTAMVITSEHVAKGGLIRAVGNQKDQTAIKLRWAVLSSTTREVREYIE